GRFGWSGGSCSRWPGGPWRFWGRCLVRGRGGGGPARWARPAGAGPGGGAGWPAGTALGAGVGGAPGRPSGGGGGGRGDGGGGVARVRTGVMLGAVASRAVSGGPSFHRSRRVAISEVWRYSLVMTVCGSM